MHDAPLKALADWASASGGGDAVAHALQALQRLQHLLLAPGLIGSSAPDAGCGWRASTSSSACATPPRRVSCGGPVGLCLASLSLQGSSLGAGGAHTTSPAASGSSDQEAAKSQGGRRGRRGLPLADVADAGASGRGAGRGGSGALVNLSGTWIKDKERSESMRQAMDIMHLSGIVRQAVKLVRGVRIDQTPEEFNFAVFSFISWFKVKEVYPMSGEERQFRRRDLRRGKHVGRVEPYGKDLRVVLRWSDPFGGTGTDHFRLVSEEELHIESVLEVGGKSARYLTVYRRKHDKYDREHHGQGQG
ncbi:hypothetical protein HYH03_016594 [Edaphochlamys debaryana]|uniref:Uncharacterized protein n=1 Tax=Edaphochlamys debaryana TaxID=47281 RepID=A0A835XLX3_9CHLO|nr:hypothetical protein HYH03_016594 [Edaphochlamys debaryana]|eukprot:KAG2484641.1 hypothetical protein HYH03_016594 [Edaphochlamys debaryana]